MVAKQQLQDQQLPEELKKYFWDCAIEERGCGSKQPQSG